MKELDKLLEEYNEKYIKHLQEPECMHKKFEYFCAKERFDEYTAKYKPQQYTLRQ